MEQREKRTTEWDKIIHTENKVLGQGIYILNANKI